jgi:Winged helix DNA-binding domain
LSDSRFSRAAFTVLNGAQAMAFSPPPKNDADRYQGRPLSRKESKLQKAGDGLEANETTPAKPTDAYLTTRLSLGANDGPVDDLLELAERWEAETGQSVFPQFAISPDNTASGDEPAYNGAIDEIAKRFSPTQMRQLGESILKLADALDQGWDPAAVRSSYHWLTCAGRIERQALVLAQVAILMRNKAKRRTHYIPKEFIGEPGWQMLLELFIQFAGGADVSTKSLCIVSGVPDTTALRVIEKMESADLIERSQSLVDKRVTLVRLTRHGVVAVGSFLMDVGR